jgi:hypothetical protein
MHKTIKTLTRPRADHTYYSSTDGSVAIVAPARLNGFPQNDYRSIHLHLRPPRLRIIDNKTAEIELLPHEIMELAQAMAQADDAFAIQFDNPSTAHHRTGQHRSYDGMVSVSPNLDAGSVSIRMAPQQWKRCRWIAEVGGAIDYVPLTSEFRAMVDICNAVDPGGTPISMCRRKPDKARHRRSQIKRTQP